MIVCPLINSQISARISDSIRYRFVVDTLGWTEATISERLPPEGLRSIRPTSSLPSTLDLEIYRFGDAIVEIGTMPEYNRFGDRV